MRPRGCLFHPVQCFCIWCVGGRRNGKLGGGMLFPTARGSTFHELRWHTPLMWAQAGRSNAVFICELGYVLNHFAICCSGVVVRTQKRIILAGKGCHGDEKQSVHTIVHAK